MPDPFPETSVTKRSWISLAAVLFVQTQNAFNDNFVKMVLIGLGLAAAQGMVVFNVDLGENIKFILTALIPIPFILGAPVAGWISDRFSKKQVLIGSLCFQLAIFILILFAILQRQVLIAIFGYFLLAVQSTLFSPAKQGILKELVGSERLGMANGLSQMLAMVGIILGIALGGEWFDSLLARFNAENGVGVENAWRAAKWPTICVGLGCLVPLLVSILIQSTPSHPEKKFKPRLWFSHFSDLQFLLGLPGLRKVAIRIGVYWFVANFIALVFVTFGVELFPNAQEGGAAGETGRMMGCVGIGLIVGSTLVSILSRQGIQVKLIPLGAIGMAIGLAGIATFDASGLFFKLSIGLVGFASGFFLVPLSALLQDLAPEDERGRIISASNLINAFTGIVASGVCFFLDSMEIPAAMQIVLVLVVMIGIAFWTFPYFKGRKEGTSVEV